MQRWVSLFFASVAVAVAIAVSYRGLTNSLEGLSARSVDAGAFRDGPSESENLAALMADDTPEELRLQLGLESDGGEVADPSEGVNPSAPRLETEAPRRVRAGIILLSYQGAEGASPKAKPKSRVAELAQRVAAQAKVDFRAAVAFGDVGSSEDVGRIPRGMLEAAEEYTLFSLPVGGVSDPIDTPRGYWIVKRLQ